MGYYTRVTGEIGIDPPLTWTEFKDSGFLGPKTESCVVLAVDEHEEETDEGTLLRRQAVAIVPAWEDRLKAYTLVEDVQAIVDAFPDRTFTGRLNCEGEESGDLWRLEVHDGRAVRVDATVTWPDGEVQVGRR